jgi:type II secretory pathway component GspD/PulD (secretin)
LLEAYQAHSRKISERQQAYRARGIEKLEVSPDSQTAGGFRVSVDLNTASLAAVMDHLVKRTGLDYSFGGSRLAERVTARFNRRPLPEALDILLGPVGYKATISGGVIRITRAAMPRTEKEVAGQVQTEVALKFIDTEFAEKFLEGLYPENRGTGQPFTFAMNPARNTVFLSGTAIDVRNAARMLEQADTDSGHVLIEVLVVEFNNEALRELGARIFDAAKGKFSDVDVDFASLFGDAISFTHIAGAANAARLTAALNILIQDETARIITRPYLATLSNVEATLEITEDRFVEVQSPSGLTASLEKVISGIQMQITPIVQVDGMIRLKMDISESRFIGGAEFTNLRTNTNNIETVTRVGDGETVIIGGLMLNRYANVDSGLPGLRDIPGAGIFFGQKDRISIARQVIIYVTPHLWTPGMVRPLVKMDKFMFYVPGADKPATPSVPEAPETPEAVEDLEIPED